LISAKLYTTKRPTLQEWFVSRINAARRMKWKEWFFIWEVGMAQMGESLQRFILITDYTIMQKTFLANSYFAMRSRTLSFDYVRYKHLPQITFFTSFIIPSTDLASSLEKANHFFPKSFSEAPK
jgi:hypothetical protein